MNFDDAMTPVTWANTTNVTSTSSAVYDVVFDAADTMRFFFYLVSPYETTYRELSSVPTFLFRGLNYIPALCVLEYIVLWLQSKSLPRSNDSLVSACALLLAFVPMLLIKNIDMFVYIYVYDNYRVVALPYNSVWTWTLCIFATEFGQYLWHRAAHEVNIVWAVHQVHHTSEEFNLTTAFRVPTFNRFVAMLFYLPVCAIFFPPSVFYVHYQLGYIYQLWVHTSAINKSPWLIEAIFQTPSHHRVHHGRNRYCIDKNYGGFLTIYDKMLGTYQEEKAGEQIYYGLVHSVNTWDILYLQTHHFQAMIRKAREVPGLSNKLNVFLKGPGWDVGKPRLGIAEDVPEIPENTVKYDKKVSVIVNVYLWIHYFIAYAIFLQLDAVSKFLTVSSALASFAFMVWTIGNISYIFEHKWYATSSELARCLAFLVLRTLYPMIFDVGLVAKVSLWMFIGSSTFWAWNYKMFAQKTPFT